MDASTSPIVFIMGPTASGKTDVAASLYESIDCELISVDAAQVFRDMNIGTAKPDGEFLYRFPHHLINIRDFDQSYSAAEFCRDANELIAEIQGRGRLPIFVGGTMFYFSALENGLSDLPGADSSIREQLESRLSTDGAEKLHSDLSAIDPLLGEKIRATDLQRLQRAMEIYLITGEVPSEVMARSKQQGLVISPIKIALSFPHRKSLHQRIELRFNMMIELGLVDEVANLLDRTEEPDKLVSMKSVGYRQVIQHLAGEIDSSEMIDHGVAATRQLAKRQLTWLRNQSNIVWFDATQKELANSVAEYLKAHTQLHTSPRMINTKNS